SAGAGFQEIVIAAPQEVVCERDFQHNHVGLSLAEGERKRGRGQPARDEPSRTVTPRNRDPLFALSVINGAGGACQSIRAFSPASHSRATSSVPVISHSGTSRRSTSRNSDGGWTMIS